jgi:class 3 adenylate cyclase
MPLRDELFDAIGRALDENLDRDELETRIWEDFGQTCAVLILDSVGFSAATQRKGIAFYLAVIVRMRRVCAELFERHGVIRWRAEADNVYAEFPTPDNAVAAAFELHEILRKKRIMLEDSVPFQVCAGIGFGRLLRSGGEGMYGQEMNLASKLSEDTARAGETLVTEAAWLNLSSRDSLAAQRRSVEVSNIEIPYFAVTPAFNTA